MQAIAQAVILAAGMGTRLRGESQPLPKPLVRVGGLTLLKRAILTARKAGITRFVIVVGCDGDRVRAAVDGDPELSGVELVFVDNPDYRKSNGVSVLKAAPHVRGEFFLMMADHVVDPAIYRVLQGEPARGGLVLAVDRKLSTIFDMDDATKVVTGERDRIVRIGKQLTEFDAVDTGVFRCDPALFERLEAVLAQKGDCSLSDGVQALAADGKARVADVGAAWWQDVDTPPTIKHAEKLLFRSLTKPIDGPISKAINRRFSKTITRLVMNTSIVPNHMTAVGLLVGLAAAAVTAFSTPASWWLLPIGGLLYQLSSMIDGCDGEIARLKFKHSDSGEWFDTISDDVINLSYQLALGFALYRWTGDALWFQLGAVTFGLGWVVCISLYRKLLANGKGTHLAIEWSMRQENAGWFNRFCAKLEFVAKRDFYALTLMVLSFIGIGAMKWAAVLSFVTVAIVAAQWGATQLRGLRTPRTPEREPTTNAG
ncbi:MAG: NTP transferase domain-containing protein [bacterium]